MPQARSPVMRALSVAAGRHRPHPLSPAANGAGRRALAPRRISCGAGRRLRREPGNARCWRRSGPRAAAHPVAPVRSGSVHRRKGRTPQRPPRLRHADGGGLARGGRYEETRLPVAKMQQALPELQCRTMQGRAIQRGADAAACSYWCGSRCRFSSRLWRSVAMALSASPGLSSLRAMRRKANSRTAGFCVRASTSRYSAGISWARPSSR